MRLWSWGAIQHDQGEAMVVGSHPVWSVWIHLIGCPTEDSRMSHRHFNFEPFYERLHVVMHFLS